MKQSSSVSQFSLLIFRIILTTIYLFSFLAFVQIVFAQEIQQVEEVEVTPTLPAEEMPTPLPGVPVEFNGEILFYVIDGVYNLTPVERAELIEKRIRDLATNPFHPETEITLAESVFGTELLAGEISILTVTEKDAESYGMTQLELAQLAAEQIQSTIDSSRQSQSVVTRFTQILAALVLAAGLLIAYFILTRIAGYVNRKIDSITIKDPGKGVIQRTRYYRTGRWKPGLKRLVIIIKWLLLILLILFGIPFLLELFPATADLASRMIALLTAPLRVTWSWLVENTNNFISLAIIAVIFYFLNRINVFIFREVRRGSITLPGFDPEWSYFTRRIVTFLLIAAAFVVSFPYIPGSDSPVFQGITIFLGALFTLTSSSAVANIVAGVIQTYTGAFHIGDVVKIDEVTGVVLEKSLISTRVLTFKNEEVTIPNDKLLKSNVINYSTLTQNSRLVLYTTVTIGYDVPWQKVHELLIAAAKSTPEILEEPPPYVLQKSLNDYNISYELNCHTNSPQRMPGIYSQLHANIQDQFNKAGVEIMSPTFTAFRDGNKLTIPFEFAKRDEN